MYLDLSRTFRRAFAAFRHCSKTRVHICRCHSVTKSLAWVLQRLPYIYYIYTPNLTLKTTKWMAYAAYAASFAHQKLKTVVISHLASPVTTQCCCCHFAPTFSQRVFAENPKRAHRVWKHLSNFCPGSRSRERPDTVCGKRQLIFSARRISHLQNLCATCGF